MSKPDTDHARDQARAQISSVVEYVAALECDYDRLQELRDALADSAAHGGTAAWASANPEDADELAALETAAGECTNEDDARQRIHDDPLSVEVRADWHNVGENPEPSEFCILLCTGGPAVRIVGDLDENKEPSRARIEYQDWGTPWTELVDMSSDATTGADARDALLTYCRAFYFGD